MSSFRNGISIQFGLLLVLFQWSGINGETRRKSLPVNITRAFYSAGWAILRWRIQPKDTNGLSHFHISVSINDCGTDEFIGSYLLKEDIQEGFRVTQIDEITWEYAEYVYTNKKYFYTIKAIKLGTILGKPSTTVPIISSELRSMNFRSSGVTTYSTAHVQWNDPNVECDPSFISRYLIEYGIVNAVDMNLIDLTMSEYIGHNRFDYTLTNLKPGSNYSLRLFGLHYNDSVSPLLVSITNYIHVKTVSIRLPSIPRILDYSYSVAFKNISIIWQQDPGEEANNNFILTFLQKDCYGVVKSIANLTTSLYPGHAFLINHGERRWEYAGPYIVDGPKVYRTAVNRNDKTDPEEKPRCIWNGSEFHVLITTNLTHYLFYSVNVTEYARWSPDDEIPLEESICAGLTELKNVTYVLEVLIQAQNASGRSYPASVLMVLDDNPGFYIELLNGSNRHRELNWTHPYSVCDTIYFTHYQVEYGTNDTQVEDLSLTKRIDRGYDEVLDGFVPYNYSLEGLLPDTVYKVRVLAVQWDNSTFPPLNRVIARTPFQTFMTDPFISIHEPSPPIITRSGYYHTHPYLRIFLYWQQPKEYEVKILGYLFDVYIYNCNESEIFRKRKHVLTLGDTNLTALIFNLTANSTNPAVDLDSVRVTGNNHIWEIDLEKDELNKTIKVIISAFNLVGSGEETEPIYIITRNASFNPNIFSKTLISIHIQWAHPFSSCGRYIVNRYRIEYGIRSSSVKQNITDIVSEEIIVSDLELATAYEFQIFGVQRLNHWPYRKVMIVKSEVFYASTKRFEGFHFGPSSNYETAITLTLNIEDEDVISYITHYQILYKSLVSFTYDETYKSKIFVAHNAHSLQFHFTDLFPGTGYRFILKGIHYDDSVEPPINISFNSPPDTIFHSRTVQVLVPGLYLGTNPLKNNSVISYFDGGLYCITNKFQCCTGLNMGSWSLPIPTKLQTVIYNDLDITSFEGNSRFVIIRHIQPSAIELRLKNPKLLLYQDLIGVYSCNIPDKDNITRIFYVNFRATESLSRSISLKQDSNGRKGSNLVITGIYLNMKSLSCTTTGRSVNRVTWFKNNTAISKNDLRFSYTEVINDLVLAIYTQVLSHPNGEAFSGKFTCQVEDAYRKRISKTVNYREVVIQVSNSLPFFIGSSRVVSCSTEVHPSLVQSIKWTSTKWKDIPFVLTPQNEVQIILDPVDDRELFLEDLQLSCEVVWGSIRSYKRFDFHIIAPLGPLLNMTVHPTEDTKAQLYEQFNVTCSVSKLIPGFTQIPTAMWFSYNKTSQSSDLLGSFSISSTISDSVSTSVLSFTSLEPFHITTYLCVGILNSSVLASPLKVYKLYDISANLRASVETTTSSLTIILVLVIMLMILLL